MVKETGLYQRSCIPGSPVSEMSQIWSPQSNDRKIELDLNCNVSEQVLKLVGDCSQHIRVDSCLQTIWTTALNSQNPMLFTGLLNLFGPEFHLPVWETLVFEKAREVICQRQEKISLILHWDPASQHLSVAVYHLVLSVLPQLNSIRLTPPQFEIISSDEWGVRERSFHLHLCLIAAFCEGESEGQSVGQLATVRILFTLFRVTNESDFLLELYSRAKDSQHPLSLIQALQPVYQSGPEVWTIVLSEGKASLFLEVLKFQTQKKPVELRGWSNEEDELRVFLWCLPYISQLRFPEPQDGSISSEEWKQRVKTFHLDLCLQAALYGGKYVLTTVRTLLTLSSVYSESDFLLDLYSHARGYESQTGRSFISALLLVYQSAPGCWSIDLSERKDSLLLEVLKLQTQKKPVVLRGWSKEENEVRNFLQCLPYISQLRFPEPQDGSISSEEWEQRVKSFHLNLCLQAALYGGEYVLTTVRTLLILSSVYNESDFLLDLYSHARGYESQTGRSFISALLPVYQSVPACWSIDLLKRKASLFLEVLKLQTQKKPVDLIGWSDEESEVRSFLQCLPYISQLRFSGFSSNSSKAVKFLVNLGGAAAGCVSDTGKSFCELLSSVCSYSTFPFDYKNSSVQSDVLLELYSCVKLYESETSRRLLPAFKPVYQSVPELWSIDLSKRKASLFLEVLKLQTQKKPVDLIGWSDEESEVRSFLQCLPHISQLRFSRYSSNSSKAVKFLVNLGGAAAGCVSDTGESFSELLSSVCSYSTFPFGYKNSSVQSDVLLDLYSCVKLYESETSRRLLPAFKPVYQSVPALWSIDLSKRKASLFLEVLKLQTQKKPVELIGWSDEESEVRSFLQCLPHISQLRFSRYSSNSSKAVKFLVNLGGAAAGCVSDTGESFSELLSSVCSYSTFPFGYKNSSVQSDVLLDLYSCVKLYESETSRRLLPAFKPVYQSVPALWSIDLSKRKASLFLEVLKLQTQKKPVDLIGWSDEESTVRSFLQCLPYISQLRFSGYSSNSSKAVKFLVNLGGAAAGCLSDTGKSFSELLSSVCSYSTFPFDYKDSSEQSDVLLELYSCVKLYESETSRRLLPAFKPVYQSVAALWSIDLSKRKASLFLEVLKLQTQKKPVDLIGWSDEESEVRSFLQCLPYISQLRFSGYSSNSSKAVKFLVNLGGAAAGCVSDTGKSFCELLSSVCSYSTFPFDYKNSSVQSDVLLELYSCVKLYESETSRRLLPAFKPVYQSVPELWSIDLSKRKASLFLEVLKLQTQKKPVELIGWSDEESEVRSFLQCLPHISQLRFSRYSSNSSKAVKFLVNLGGAAAGCVSDTGESFSELLSSVCSYSTFPFGYKNSSVQSDVLLDLYSCVKLYESETSRRLLPAFKPVYQSVPALWSIDLSKRKASLFLEVLKLQTQKKPVELIGWSDEESEVRSFLQCLPHISQLRFSGYSSNSSKAVKFLVNLGGAAAGCVSDTGESFSELLSSVCSYSTFPFGYKNSSVQSDVLLDLYSCVKLYESETSRRLLPAFKPVYQSVPALWSIDLSKRKASLFLEVLKLQTQKKPVELIGWSDEESEVRSFLQCLPHISQLRFSRYSSNSSKAVKFLVNLGGAAAGCVSDTGESFSELLSSVCSYSTFPFGYKNSSVQSDVLLDLYSCVKLYESETSRRLLPAFKPVYQSVPALWSIDLSKRKASLFLEVLKLQTQKKPVELIGWSDEESEVRSFLQCLPHISQLRFSRYSSNSSKAVKFLVNLGGAAAGCVSDTGESFSELLSSVCSYSTFPFGHENSSVQSDVLLDLYSCVKLYESETSRKLLPAFKLVYQSVPALWSIDLSKRKTSLFLEVLKLQTQKKPVDLIGWSDEESEVRSFLHCLPYISQLSFLYRKLYCNAEDVFRFLLDLCVGAAEHCSSTGQSLSEFHSPVCAFLSCAFDDKGNLYGYSCDFMLDLYSRVRGIGIEIGRSLLPALQPFYQSAPAVWSIDLSERKASLLLEVLQLQTQKKPVELRDWSDEESEVRSFLQCLPYISELRFSGYSSNSSKTVKFLVNLGGAAAECVSDTGESFSELLSSVCSYSTFPFGHENSSVQSDVLLDLYSCVKLYESETSRKLLPAFKLVYQSVPALWSIDLSKRKTSLFLEVLKLQTQKKPVDLIGWSDEESEVRSFLHCLPYISQLSFLYRKLYCNAEDVFRFLLDLCVGAAEHCSSTGQSLSEFHSPVCAFLSCAFDDKGNLYGYSCDFMLDLYSRVRGIGIEIGRSLLPALQPFYQSAPAVWSIDLSERKASLLLEVLQLQTQKKPVELRDWSDEESEVRSFLQCLPYISELRFSGYSSNSSKTVKFLVNLGGAAAECVSDTGESFSELLSSVCSYSTFPFGHENSSVQSDVLLDLYSCVKLYESETSRKLLPAFKLVYQSVPALWSIDLSKRKTSLFLEVLKLQTQKKPVDLIGWSDEESEVRSFLHCLPYISQLSVLYRKLYCNAEDVFMFLLDLCVGAAEHCSSTGQSLSEFHSPVCAFLSCAFDDKGNLYGYSCDFMLDLYSRVRGIGIEIGRSLLPALQPFCQSAPAVWSIDLSERKASLLLEVLQLQTQKKPVELRDWSDEESEVRSFLQCLPYISELRFSGYSSNSSKTVKFLVNLGGAAAECVSDTGESFSELLSSVCSYSTFPLSRENSSVQSDVLLKLYSCMRHYESVTSRRLLPVFKPIYQSAPAHWTIDLSKRKASLFLEVLKLQTQKKPVDLIGWSDEESTVRSFLQCLPYISQLRFSGYSSNSSKAVKFLVNLGGAAAECVSDTGKSFCELLSSVCSYSTFPFGYENSSVQSDVLLELYSRVKHYESETSRRLLPVFKPVYQSAPAHWYIDLSKRKASLFLEVLKLQKKPVELRCWSDEESEVRSFLQCLPYISQLRLHSGCDAQSLLLDCADVGSREELTLLVKFLDFNLKIGGDLYSSKCRSLGRVLSWVASRLDLTLTPEHISLRGVRLLIRGVNHHKLRLNGKMVMRLVRAMRTGRGLAPVTVEELSLDLNSTGVSQRVLSRVLSGLALLLRLWTVRCLDLTSCRVDGHFLITFLCHQDPLKLRLNKEDMQQLFLLVSEVQEVELTQSFLDKVGGDLTNCTLTPEVLLFMLQHYSGPVTVDLRKSKITERNTRELLPLLDRIRFKRLSPGFIMSIIREIYQTRSPRYVSSLLRSTENYINLTTRALDAADCAALHFTLQHSQGVRLNLMWTFIPEGELENFLQFFSNVFQLSVDRQLLLRFLNCCYSSDVQQGAAAALLQALQHRLDFSCSSAMDLTDGTQEPPLHLRPQDCRVISMVIQMFNTNTTLTLTDCDVVEAGLQHIFSALERLRLRCTKGQLLQFLTLVQVGSEIECVRRAVSLSRAVGGELDLSHTVLDDRACGSLALFLEYSEGLSELDLSHCQLTDRCLEPLLPHLHKIQVLDLSNNSITDKGAQQIYNTVNKTTSIQTVRLFNNVIKSKQLYLGDKRFELW
ncbi:uncharacterized protein LOC121689383 [Alosa sapidissima]|uniref:uncharacterized protein LOC121689383 n=1 Tax=Alosa sapidissima TaxID=34773 RepID=UPI001C0845E8|nr:uncharacterized protein LOC121689383 [Alosa sapidissima]